MNKQLASSWVRLKVSGTLHCLSPLLIGNGDYEPLDDSKDDAPLIKSLMLDTHNKPFIPASTLRGVLRASFESCPDDHQQALLHFFGIARRNQDEMAEQTDEDFGQAGCLYAYDARVSGSFEWLERQRIMMNPVTGTVQEHMLANERLVKEGARFRCEFEIVKPTSYADLRVLLRALNSLSVLGQGKSIGRGLMNWQLDETGIVGITQDAMRQWLLLDTPALPYEPIVIDNVDSLQKLASGWSVFTADLYARSPCLINAPELVPPDKGKPKLEFRREEDAAGNGKAIIPGSALKGLLRARCHKILRTVMQDDAQISPLLDGLFGSTDAGAGCLRFMDSFAPYTCAEKHLQTFTAIDRFTGGVTDGALYVAHAVQPTAPFKVSIHYQKNHLSAAMKGLLLLLLRDAMEGDLSIGWGKSKGYGALQLALSDASDWQAYVAQWDDDERAEIETCLEAFDDLKTENTEINTHA